MSNEALEEELEVLRERVETLEKIISDNGLDSGPSAQRRKHVKHTPEGNQ